MPGNDGDPEDTVGLPDGREASRWVKNYGRVVGLGALALTGVGLARGRMRSN